MWYTLHLSLAQFAHKEAINIEQPLLLSISVKALFPRILTCLKVLHFLSFLCLRDIQLCRAREFQVCRVLDRLLHVDGVIRC